MANVEWRPTQGRIKQKVKVTVGGTIATETFTISIGGVVMATFTAATSTATQVRDGLKTDWDSAARAHPYKTNILTWTNNSTDAIDIEAVQAGVPFTLTLNTPGGTATFTQSTTQANVSPNDLGDTANWSAGALPTTSDNVRFPYGVPVPCWNLDAITATLGDVEIEDGFNIGMPSERFSTQVADSGPGAFDASVKEYRGTFTTLKCANIYIGRLGSLGPTLPTGIQRCHVDLSTAPNAKVYAFRSAAQSGAHPPIQLKLNHSGSVVSNYGAVLGVGQDLLGDASVLSAIYNHSTEAKTIIGNLVTIATGDNSYGTMILYSLPTSLLVRGQNALTYVMKSGTIPTIRGAGVLNTQGANFQGTSIE